MGQTHEILVIDKLHKTFKSVVALKGIDLTLDKPGVYGFLGPNGAGKSTTFKLICSLLRPTSGRVIVDGTDVQKDPRRAVTRLGVHFDSPSFYPYLSGRDNLVVFSRWLDEPLGGKRIDGLLSLVGLTEAAKRKVGGYSWGMKQRLGLASALLSDPMLVLLDEPTNGLDPRGIADIRGLLPRLARDEGRTVFLSSHRMEEVEHVCDHVTIIHEGEIVASGTPDELASSDSVIEVHCADPRAAARILVGLDGLDDVDVVAATRLQIRSSEIKTSRITQYLIEQGIAVDQVIRRRESLEQVFFRLTGSSQETQTHEQ
jgi:ABC-2 type transport system ATP-binding protein